jgi:hypothetical protein
VAKNTDRLGGAGHARVEQVLVKLRILKHDIREQNDFVLHSLESVDGGVAGEITSLPDRSKLESSFC